LILEKELAATMILSWPPILFFEKTVLDHKSEGGFFSFANRRNGLQFLAFDFAFSGFGCNPTRSKWVPFTKLANPL
jgi:hypothetical protein